MMLNQKYAEGQRKWLFPYTGVLNQPGEMLVYTALKQTSVTVVAKYPSSFAHSIQQNEDVAEGHGKEHPTSPNVRFQPVEKIGHKDSGNDHDGGKLVLSDVIAIRSGSGHKVTVQDEEIDDRRL
jgi:hypothetical protein